MFITQEGQILVWDADSRELPKARYHLGHGLEFWQVEIGWGWQIVEIAQYAPEFCRGDGFRWLVDVAPGRYGEIVNNERTVSESGRQLNCWKIVLL